MLNFATNGCHFGPICYTGIPTNHKLAHMPLQTSTFAANLKLAKMDPLSQKRLIPRPGRKKIGPMVAVVLSSVTWLKWPTTTATTFNNQPQLIPFVVIGAPGEIRQHNLWSHPPIRFFAPSKRLNFRLISPLSSCNWHPFKFSPFELSLPFTNFAYLLSSAELLESAVRVWHSRDPLLSFHGSSLVPLQSRREISVDTEHSNFLEQMCC